jgi:hypothetical protein
MNTANKHRTGPRNGPWSIVRSQWSVVRARSLDRGLGKRLDHYTTRMMGGLRRPPPPNYLAEACRLFSAVVRSRKRLAKLMPEYFDPDTIARRQREFIQQERDREWLETVDRALERIYGPEGSL